MIVIAYDSGVQRWVRETQVMETNWSTAPLILVPIFAGPRGGGHWLGLIIDCGRQQLVGGSRELYVYQDSLSSDSVNRTSKAVQERLQ